MTHRPPRQHKPIRQLHRPGVTAYGKVNVTRPDRHTVGRDDDTIVSLTATARTGERVFSF
jgi:hypothetical protein